LLKPCTVGRGGHAWPSPGGIDQRQHQDAGDAAALPGIVDGNGEFALVAARPGDIARHADLHVPPVALDNGHQCKVPHIVDFGQVFQLAGRQFLQRGHEALVARVGRKMLDEILFQRLVFGADGADGDRAAVEQETIADQFGGIVGHGIHPSEAVGIFPAR